MLGIDIRVHLSWLLVFGVVLFSLSNPRGILAQLGPGWTDRELLLIAAVATLAFFTSVVVHELAHALVAKAFHMPVSSITLFLLGGVANLAKEPPRARAEFLMAIAGPATSVAIGAAGLGVCQVVFIGGGGCGALFDGRTTATFAAADAVGVVAAYLGLVNLVLAAFNMVPGFPLDGGRVFRSIMWAVMHDRARATYVAARGGQAFAALLMLVGVWRAVTQDDTFGAVWTALIAYFLYNAASQSIAQERIAATVSGVKVGPLMTTRFESVGRLTSLAELVQDHMLLHNARSVAVLEGDRFAGLVTSADLRKVDQREWPMMAVERVMLPAREIPSVSPDSRLLTAIERFAGADVPAMPVVQDGVLVGMLEREAVTGYVRMREMLGLDTRR